MGIADSASGFYSIGRGYGTLFPRLTLSREVGRGRRLRRIINKLNKIRIKITDQEKEGSISGVRNAMKRYEKLLLLEEKTADKEVRGEEKVELYILDMLGDLVVDLKNEKDFQKRISQLVEMINAFATLQFKKLEYMLAGGRPWEGVGDIANYNTGQCVNIVMTKAREQRRLFGSINSNSKRISSISGKLLAEKRSKVPRLDRIKDLKSDMEKAIKDLESGTAKYLESVKFQFFVMLRFSSFILDEINKEENAVNRMVGKEGLDAKHGEELRKILNKAKNRFTDDLRKEGIGAQRLIQASARKAA